MKKIWCLFSIANDYNQPANNLEAWFSEKPSVEILAKIVSSDLSNKEGHDNVGKLYRGLKIRFNGTTYRLEEVQEGQQ